MQISLYRTKAKARLPRDAGPTVSDVQWSGLLCKAMPWYFFFSTCFKNKDSFYETIVSLSSDSKTTNFLFHLAFSFSY